nr:Chain C, Insulin-like growth factor-binding protein-like 1 altered peptide [Homo sapiens]
LLLPRLPPL